MMQKILSYLLLFLCCTSFSFQADKPLYSFLKNPFDLHSFKKAKGQSNSGGAYKKTYYYKPKYKGFYFSFFLFEPSTGYTYSRDGKIKTEKRMKNGLDIITYKYFNKYRNDYLDPTEMLIDVKAHYNDKDLPQLSFIGLDTAFIKRKLGNNFIRRNNCFIYHADNYALTLTIKDGRIDWLRYTRLKFNITDANLPAGLLNENE